MTSTLVSAIRALGFMLLIVATAGPVAARALSYPGIYFAPDVVDQFNSLARRGDGLAFNLGSIPREIDPSLCKHLQGLARLPGPGTPYLYISRSGNDPGASCITGFEPDDPGNIFIVRMGSRETSGERLRTNRLVRDWPGQLSTPIGPVPWTKPPDSRDRLVGYVSLSGDWPYYAHPGGMQIVDNVLAVAVETPYDGGHENIVLFVDVTDPEQPRLLSQFPRSDSSLDMGHAGLVGLTPVLNPDGPGLRYIMLSTGGDNSTVRLWRSLPTGGPNNPTDLRSPSLDWEEIGHFTTADLEAPTCSGGVDWPEGRDAHQSLNFVRENNLAGPLYLVGGRNTGVGGDGRDILTLYRMNLDSYGNPGVCLMNPVVIRHVSSYPFNGHGDSAALSAAGGTYVSPSGELIVYGTEYENDGPWELLPNGAPGTRTVRFVEWRNIEVVRRDSPTLRPSVQVEHTVTVSEGASVTISGLGRPPITKAWVQLFEDDGAGRELPGIGDTDDWLQIDYEDRAKDHFENFPRLDATTGTHFDDQAGSWRWFAPEGCTLRVNEDPFGASTGIFPGRHTLTLVGDGGVHAKDDLNDVLNDAADAYMDDKISSVQFNPLNSEQWESRCADYYTAPIAVSWDLDGDGTFEANGNEGTFSAAQLDGPAHSSVSARAQHPTDTTVLGQSDPVGVTVAVLNVAPQIGPLDLRDSLGNTVGTTVPFVLQGLPVTLTASFTDPGRPDRQTSSLDWGDSVTDHHTSFASFSDAFGGVTGSLQHSHAFATPGDRLTTLQVADDDGGVTNSSAAVRILTPDQAVEEIGALLQGLILTTTDPAVLRDLEAARRTLIGSHLPQSSDGALAMIRAGVYAAAESFLRTSIDRLLQAGAGGADVAVLVSLLRQVSAVLPGG
jgi:hypothetical protein